MIGVSRQVNPALKDAGDSVGYADTGSVERICAENPGVRFLVTMLATGKSARPVRGRAEIQQPDALRVLVVPQQPLDC